MILREMVIAYARARINRNNMLLSLLDNSERNIELFFKLHAEIEEAESTIRNLLRASKNPTLRVV